MMGLSDGKKISMMRSAVLTQITRVMDRHGIGVKKRGMKSMHIFVKVGGH